MTYYARDVERFQEKFGLPTPNTFRFLPDDLHDFRVGFFNEELDEYLKAHREGDLEIAIDSLIDLVYITCGAALLHGISSTGFEVFCALNANVIFEAEGEPLKHPVVLGTQEHAKLVKRLHQAIEGYELAHAKKNRAQLEMALGNLYVSCLNGAGAMGVSERCWNELWDDVQRANMTKERGAKNDARSKRGGSPWDIVKPEGWQPPRTGDILKKYLPT